MLMGLGSHAILISSEVHFVINLISYLVHNNICDRYFTLITRSIVRSIHLTY